MRDYSQDYPGFVNPPDAAYPQGSPKNATTDTAEDGTPVEEKWVGDVWGFLQSIMSEAGTSVNGQTESVSNPQLITAIKKICRENGSDFISKNNGAIKLAANGILWQTKDLSSASQTVGGSGWYRADGGNRVETDVTSQRASGVTYTNTTDYDIEVTVNNDGIAGGSINFVIDGVGTAAGPFSGQSGRLSITKTVKPGSTYAITFSISPLQQWRELRIN